MEDIEQTAVFVKDSDGVMVYANDAFARLLRRGGAAELVGRRTEDFFPAEAAAMLDREDSSVVEKGVPFSVERKLHSPQATRPSSSASPRSRSPRPRRRTGFRSPPRRARDSFRRSATTCAPR